MHTSPIKKLLVLLDGSERSMETVRYLADEAPLRGASLVLFHVFNAVPECYWDLAKSPKSVKVVPSVMAWQSQQKKEIQAYMQRAKELLVAGGFSASHIRVTIHNRKNGIARDILEEARKPYDAVVMRRRGNTLLPAIVMGSVATKLIQRLTYLPILIAGVHPPGKRALIAFDGSPGAFRAVAFAGRVFHGTDTDLLLLHVLRGQTGGAGNGLFAPVECIEEARARIHKAFDKAMHQLEAVGIPADRVTCRTLEGMRSRADAVAKEAVTGGFGTIIVGRRGQSRVRRFFLGRVGDKIIHMARERSVWIIN